jgi:lipoyl-dependent peroxiredoxin
MSDLIKSAEVIWTGDLRSGRGTITTASGRLRDAPYSFATRFENDTRGTNPEELIAAAAAGCFSMALSKLLTDSGSPPREIRTKAEVSLVRTPLAFRVSKVHLATQAQVPGISKESFADTANQAKEGCPISQLLKPGLDALTLDATLIG